MNLLDIATNKLHYKRLREDPIYRLQCQLDDMGMEMEPPFCQDIPERTEFHYIDTEWSNRQWDTVQQLKADNVHLRTQWYEHLKEDREYRATKRKGKQPKYE